MLASRLVVGGVGNEGEKGDGAGVALESAGWARRKGRLGGGGDVLISCIAIASRP